MQLLKQNKFQGLSTKLFSFTSTTQRRLTVYHTMPALLTTQNSLIGEDNILEDLQTDGTGKI